MLNCCICKYSYNEYETEILNNSVLCDKCIDNLIFNDEI